MRREVSNGFKYVLEKKLLDRHAEKDMHLLQFGQERKGDWRRRRRRRRDEMLHFVVDFYRFGMNLNCLYFELLGVEVF